jgi:hypothetical protein
MPVESTPELVPLSVGAKRANLTSEGLLKILRRTGSAIRDDGRWYVDPTVVDQIATARRVLGVDRSAHARAAHQAGAAA